MALCIRKADPSSRYRWWHLVTHLSVCLWLGTVGPGQTQWGLSGLSSRPARECIHMGEWLLYEHLCMHGEGGKQP